MSDEMEEQIELYPPWREAVKAFEQGGFTYGDTMPRAWFIRAIGMEVLPDDAKMTPEQYNRYELAVLQQFTSFREAVLEKYQKWLVTDNAGGYTIVPPHEQATRAYEQMTRDIKAALRKGGARIQHTNVARLTDQQRADYADKLGKAASLAALFKARRALPFEDDE